MTDTCSSRGHLLPQIVSPISLSLNSLTAAYLATSPPDGVRTIAGKIAFRLIVGQSMLDALRASSWAVWSSCYLLNSWYTRDISPGSHYTTLFCLPTTTGYATDGVNFFAVPEKHKLLEVVTRIRSGLMDGLTNHPLALSGPRDHHPSWTHVVPQYRFFAQWTHPAWVQHAL